MKRFLIYLVFALCVIECYSQSLMFSLHKDGAFLTDDGMNYKVLTFDGKTAKELYNIVNTNAVSLYKSPNTVMSVNEGVSISIRGYKENLIGAYGAYYNLIFEFKDGRMKINAPLANEMDSSVVDDILWGKGAISRNFGREVQRRFVRLERKNAKVAAKAERELKATENYLNMVVNYLAGLSSASPSNENW